MKTPTTDVNFPEMICVSRSGYGLQALPTFETATMTSGRPESYRLFSFVPSEVKMRLVVNDGDALAFEMWFRDVIDDGVKWFNANIRTPRSRNDNVVAKFKDMYSGPQLHDNGDFWVYTFTLYVFERPLWPAPWGELPDWVANASRFDVLMNWVWPEYVTEEKEFSDYPIFVSDGRATTFIISDGMYEAISADITKLEVRSFLGVVSAMPTHSINGVTITLQQPLERGDAVLFNGTMEIYKYDS